jgi:hypothetical protein
MGIHRVFGSCLGTHLQDLLATACHHPPSAIIFTALCSEEVGFETADTKSNIGTFALALPL